MGSHVLPGSADIRASVPAGPGRSRHTGGFDQHVSSLRAGRNCEATSGGEQETFELHGLNPLIGCHPADHKIKLGAYQQAKYLTKHRYDLIFRSSVCFWQHWAIEEKPLQNSRLAQSDQLTPNPDRPFERTPHLFRLAKLPAEAFQPRLEHRDVSKLRERDALDAAPALHVGQLDAPRRVGAADGPLGLGSLCDRGKLVEEALAHHRDADVAGAQ